MAAKAPSVPWLLVRLKLRLIRNGLRTPSGVVGAVGGTVLALIGGLLALTAAFAASTTPPYDHVGPVLAATGVFLVWLLLPLLVTGTDDTLDPGRLVLLPLRQGPLLLGMALAALVGFGPLGVEIGAVGAIFAFGSGTGLPVVIAAVLLLLALCAVASRTLVTLLAGAMASRRWRDAVIVGASLVGLSLQAIRFLPGRVSIGERTLVDIAAVARWTPPGMLGQAVADAGHGDVGTSAAELLMPALSIALIWWGWTAAHRRAEGRVVSEGQAARPSRAGGERRLALLPERFATRSRPWLAVASKELRYARRDPRRKVALLNAFVISAGLPVFLAISQEDRGGHDVVLYATFAGYFAVLGAMNQFGLDGPALWLDIAAGERLRDVLIGKNVALAVLIVPFIGLLAIGLAVFSGGWAYVPSAMLLAVGGLGAALAVANVVSVKIPQAMPESGNPFGRRGGGQGCINGLVGMAAMLVQGIVISPLAGAATVAAFAGLLPVFIVSIVGVGYGYLVWRAGLALAVEDGHRRQPELLIAVDPRRA